MIAFFNGLSVSSLIIIGLAYLTKEKCVKRFIRGAQQKGIILTRQAELIIIICIKKTSNCWFSDMPKRAGCYTMHLE